jgi:histidinol dehydrogenase
VIDFANAGFKRRICPILSCFQTFGISKMSNLTIKKLNAAEANFDAQLKDLLAWNETDDLAIHQRVLGIIADVRKRGDDAVIEYTNRFDHCDVSAAGELEISKEKLKAAWENLPADQATALEQAVGKNSRLC